MKVFWLSEIGQFDRSVQPDLMQQSFEFEHPYTPIFYVVDIGKKKSTLYYNLKSGFNITWRLKNAALWLKEKNTTLGNNTPIGLLDTSSGIEMIFNVLGRIEHGGVS